MGSRAKNKLTDRGVKAAKDPGWYGDGEGLYLRVLADGKRWVYVFRWGGKRAEMGMGSYPDVSLSEAREGLYGRDWARDRLKENRNPVEVRRAEREAAEKAAEPKADAVTFRTWATEVAPAIGPKSEKAAKKWLKSITDDAGTLAEMAPAEIQTEHVLAALKPYWTSRPDTGSRMRQRIARVLDAARARGHIAQPQWSNPAAWRGHLENLLRAPPVTVQHHKAVPYAELPAFMADLRQRDSMAALALQWTILTAARTSMTIFAAPGEVDKAGRLWTVPAARMKGKESERREHRTPLTDAAVEILEKATSVAVQAPFLFPSTFRPGRPLSTAAMERIMDDMGWKGRATVHGMRSAFSDWAHDCTNFSHETIEAALAHVQGDEVSRAYRRGDALEKRRRLMEAWAGYLLRPAGSNVRTLGRVG